MKYFLLISSIFFTDLLSKEYIKKKIGINEKLCLYKDKLYIYHIKNEGLAYGVLKKFKKLISILISVCFLFIGVLFLKSMKDDSKIKKLAFSFAFGGALGNVYDRIRNKSITDFIYIKSSRFKNMPIFNIADIFLVLAPFIVFFEALKEEIYKHK